MATIALTGQFATKLLRMYYLFTYKMKSQYSVDSYIISWQNKVVFPKAL